MTPAGTSNELDIQNGWEENTTHIYTRERERERKYVPFVVPGGLHNENKTSLPLED